MLIFHRRAFRIYMNISEYKFDDYVNAKRNEYDIHPNISEVNDRIHKSGKPTNVIYYGPDGVGKYSCALDYISRYSQGGLGYEKKMVVETSKGDINVRLSNVHFEVDLGLLGCNAKQLWNDIIKHIYDVLSLRKERMAFVLCKNFQDIHAELLDVFYSYMQTTNRAIRVNFVILTNCTSFIPCNIVRRCLKVRVPRPSKQHATALRKEPVKACDISTASNLRKWKDGITGSQHDCIVDDIVKAITDIQPDKHKFDFISLRDRVYDINVMGFNPWAVAWGIIQKLLVDGHIPESRSREVVDETACFLELFNNNYRPIYHLERYVYFLATVVNEL